MRKFEGQTYHGREGNTDIDQIQLYSLKESDLIYFCAITRKDSPNAGGVVIIEGFIKPGKDVNEPEKDVYFTEIDIDEPTKVRFNTRGLGRSIMNAHHNLAYPKELEVIGRQQVPSKPNKNSNSHKYVSDQEGQPSIRYVSPTNGGNGVEIQRGKHMRIGYKRKNGVLVPPCVIHPGDFNPEELLDAEFSPEAEPSIEVTRDYSLLKPDEIEAIIKKRDLRYIEYHRREHQSRQPV